MKTKFNGILTLLLAFVVQITFAQEKTISGTVVDETNMPLPGATVLIKGTTTGASTDFDGKYSISANTGDVLTFSYVGYSEKTATVGSSNKIDIALDLDNSLEQVVVTAFGIKKSEKALGYAVTNVKGDDLAQAKESNLVNALAGKAAGVQITSSSGAAGASSRIVLRGASSITGNNQPLFVIDGIPLDNGANSTANSSGGFDLPNGAADINPDDIETLTVLKGPNAAALYGLRAANGVIVITTKKGSSSDKLGVNINSSISFENPLVLPSFQNSYGQGVTPYGFNFVDGATGDGGVDESWGPALDTGLEFVQWNSNGQPAPWVSQPDNVKDFYRTGITLNNNVSFSGGTEKATYRMSLGHMEQEGMVPNTDFERFNVGGNFGLNLSDKARVGLNVKYIKSLSDNLVTQGYSNENPVQQMIWGGRNVDWNALRDWENLPLADPTTLAGGTPANWNTQYQNNPYWVLDNNTNDYNKDRVIGGVNLGIDLYSWLTFNIKTGIDSWNSISTERKLKGTNSNQDGYYREVLRDRFEINSEALLSSNHKITEKLGLTLNVGANQMRRRTSLTFMTASALELPGVFNISNIKSGIDPAISSRAFEQRINSVLGFGQLSYDNFLFLDFSARNDWASILPTDNNSFFYPSVTASVVLSDALNIKNDYISFIKVRGGWSKVGSTGSLGSYQLENVYRFNTTPWAGANFIASPSLLNNPDIKPESTTGIEFGLDARFFKNRLRLDATYYDQLSEDLIVDVQLSSTSGNGSSLQNIGEMSNKGFEIALGATVFKNDDWKVDLDLNFAQNRNKVESLGGDLETLVLGGQWGVDIEARVGEPYGTIYGPGYARNDNGDIIYEDGLPTVGDRKILGNVTPDWTGGANLTVAYKNFSFGALVDAKIGGDIFSMTNTWGRYAGVLEETAEGRETGVVGVGVMNVGTEENPVWQENNIIANAKDYNRAAYVSNVAEGSVFDASFVKLRQLSLGYKLPNKVLKNTGLDEINFAIVGRNLAILHKNAPHIDPESAFSNSNGNQGLEFGQLPSARSIGFNVGVKF
jgi:TonB-linked SusC/RagA family outer membrane protein